MLKVMALLAMLVMPGAHYTPVSTQAALNKEFTLKVGQEATIGNTKLKIKLISVEDSRCPQGVDCVWQGNGRVELGLKWSKSKAQTIALNTTLEPREAAFKGYTVKLVAIAPYPKSGVETNSKEYSVTLAVSK